MSVNKPLHFIHMSLNTNNFGNFSLVRFNKEVEVEGLNVFVKNIEKYFFSKVTVRNCSPFENSIQLVIELDCNFELSEALHHFAKHNWGNFRSSECSFTQSLNQFKNCNDIQIDVEEFSLFLKDTSIIINSIYNNSISEQLENIFNGLTKNHIYFTKGLSEIPFEIYIPVFEDNLVEHENTQLKNIQLSKNSSKDYFSFWGVYYDSEDDAVIYDLKNQLIINGDLQLLNQ